MNHQPLYLVDASIYIFRAYYSMPATFVDNSGEMVNAVYGYTSFLLDLLERQPESLSCAFDESLNTCFRNDIYPEYKANRDLPDANLAYQLAACQEVTSLLGLHSVCLQDYEADDIIGTLHKKFAPDRLVIIVSRDKDLGQLLGEADLLWDFAADDYAGPAEIKARFGVAPEQIADYLALAGDAVDNIPGVSGVGAKSAAALLNEFGDIDAMYERIDEVPGMTSLRGAKKIKATLVEQESLVRMFRKVTRIMCDIELDVVLDDLRPAAVDLHGVTDFCTRMKFGDRIARRMAGLASETDA